MQKIIIKIFKLFKRYQEILLFKKIQFYLKRNFALFNKNCDQKNQVGPKHDIFVVSLLDHSHEKAVICAYFLKKQAK
jgi:hypothetical protein